MPIAVLYLLAGARLVFSEKTLYRTTRRTLADMAHLLFHK